VGIKYASLKKGESMVVIKKRDYVSIPMTETLYWNRVGWLMNAMLTADDFEFRLIYFHKLQEMMRYVP
tara:strand:+ start:428 stop:631 length:204 start_codon:yes stop_codon:yes gene_type:complete